MPMKLARVIAYIYNGLCMLISELPKIEINVSLLAAWKLVLKVPVFRWHKGVPSAKDLVCGGQDINVLDFN